MQEAQGDFGCFLQLGHNWADTEATKKSYELWQRYVVPVINDLNGWRATSFQKSVDQRERFGNLMASATATAIDQHKARQS